MTKTIKHPTTIRVKTPTTVRELGDLAERLGLKVSELWALLDDTLVERWWEHSEGEVTFTFTLTPIPVPLASRVENSTPAEATTPPAGYVLAKGCSDLWIGTETLNRGWIITPAWNSTTGAHTIELWAPKDDKLTPAEAVTLAADLLAVAQTAGK